MSTTTLAESSTGSNQVDALLSEACLQQQESNSVQDAVQRLHTALLHIKPHQARV